MRWTLLVFLVVLFPAETRAAMPALNQAHVGSMATTADTAAASLSFPFTCIDSETAVYVIGLLREGAPTPTPIINLVYHGLAFADFTEVGTFTLPAVGPRRLMLTLWRALPGAACDGAAHTLQVTIQAARQWAVGALAYTGVSATNPDDPPLLTATAGTIAATGIVTSETGDLVMGCLLRSTNSELLSQAGQTERFNQRTTHTTEVSNIRAVCATKPGAPAVTLGWNADGPQSEGIALGMNLNGAWGAP